MAGLQACNDISPLDDVFVSDLPSPFLIHSGGTHVHVSIRGQRQVSYILQVPRVDDIPL